MMLSQEGGREREQTDTCIHTLFKEEESANREQEEERRKNVLLLLLLLFWRFFFSGQGFGGETWSC